MNCTEARELLSAYYDEELSVDSRERVEAHLHNCHNCSGEVIGFEQLTMLASSLHRPETPASVWTAIKEGLEPSPSTTVTVGSGGRNRSQNRFLQIAASIAAVVLIGIIGSTLWHGGHQHEEMAHAIEKLAAHIDSKDASTILLNQFGGQVASIDDAVKLVGYHPIVDKGLPHGYSVENMHVLEMPCCKCVQTACRRPDSSRIFIFEHENEDTGWFEGRGGRNAECGGKTCRIVELDNAIAVTWRANGRHVTMLGIKDAQEVEMIMSSFETHS